MVPRLAHSSSSSSSYEDQSSGSCWLDGYVLCDSWCLNIYAGINYFQHTPDKEWFQTDAVLRVSLGNFLFFTILAILMIGVKNQKDPRDSLHHGGWMMKIICWCVLVLLMFFLPNEIISLYGMCWRTTVLVLFNCVSVSCSFVNFFLIIRGWLVSV